MVIPNIYTIHAKHVTIILEDIQIALQYMQWKSCKEEQGAVSVVQSWNRTVSMVQSWNRKVSMVQSWNKEDKKIRQWKMNSLFPI